MDSANAWPPSLAVACLPNVDARAASACPPDANVACGLVHLKRRSEYLRVAREGRSAALPGLILQLCRGDEAGATGGEKPLRLGVTVTRKVGNAVVRNRVRRRLRAVARQVLPGAGAAGCDCVLIGRTATVRRPFAALVADLTTALGRLLPDRRASLRQER